jgi:hypothetical protein
MSSFRKSFRSPVFVAKFADGETTRMHVHAEFDGELNLGRGIRLAQHAYRLRMKREPPAIAQAHFERDGAILETYTAAQLEIGRVGSQGSAP